MAPKRARRGEDPDAEDPTVEDHPLALDDALPPQRARPMTEEEEEEQDAAATAAAAAAAPVTTTTTAAPRPGPPAARRQAMADAARRRAAHFAHFDPDNDQLVGPRPNNNNRRRRRGDEGDDADDADAADAGAADEADDDPHTGGAAANARELGPWASAAQLDAGRGRAALRRAAKLREAAVEGAKAAREAARLWRPRPATADATADANQIPAQPVAQPAGAVPALASLALRVIADHIDDVESLYGLPCALRNDLAAELSRRRALSEPAAFLLAQDLPPELVLPDCTQADARAAARLAREAAHPGLERLDLGFCGRGFGDEAVGTGGFGRGGRGSLPLLKEVRLSGAYRLGDDGLAALLEAAATAPVAAAGEGAAAGAQQDEEAGGGSEAAGDRGLYGDHHGSYTSNTLSSSGVLSLSLPQCPRLEGPCLRRLPELAPHLRALDLTECRGLSSAALRLALPRLDRLRSLTLDGVTEADETVVIEAVAGGAAARAGRLRELSLRGCAAGCTDAALAAVAACASAPALEALRLDECHAFSDAGLDALASTLRALRELSLRRCSPQLSDAALARLASSAGAGSLRRANVSGLPGVGPLLASALAQNCSSTLEALDVSFCRSVPEEALGLVADGCPQLGELRVFGCSQLTRKFLHGHANAPLASGEALLGTVAGRALMQGGIGGRNAHGGVIGVGTFVVHGAGDAGGGGGGGLLAGVGG